MKNEKQKQIDEQIKEEFFKLKHKRSFLIALALHLGLKNKNVTRNWFYYDTGIPVKYQTIVAEKIELQLKYDKITYKKVWS